MNPPRSPRALLARALPCALLTLCACASVGKFVWVDQYDGGAGPSEPGYVIAPGDMLNVRVYNQDGMSARARVRPDGKVSLPFLNDVEAAGQPPTALAQDLQARLKEYINQPVVTVSLEEPARMSIPILGEVVRPGVVQLEGTQTGLLQALALAGGLNEFAHKDRIFVLRPEKGATTRVRFTFEALAHADGKASQFRLREGDSIVVE